VGPVSNNLEELSAHLQDVEASAEQGVGLSASRHYAGVVISEFVYPVETLNNLLFLL